MNCTETFCPIDHVAIDVADMDTALAFFQDVFGMTITRTQGPEAAPTSLWLSGGVQLCRVESQAADCGRVGHLAFQCLDVDAVLRRAAPYGAEPVPDKGHHWFRALGITFEMKVRG